MLIVAARCVLVYDNDELEAVQLNPHPMHLKIRIKQSEAQNAQ